MTVTQRVLIADDDEDLVEIIAHRCLVLGLEIERAYDGTHALQKINKLDPDLIIMDVNMSGSSGLQVCEMISKDPFLRSIPVITLTGRKDDETIRTCHELRTFYVPKGPDVWSRLEPLVIELLGLVVRSAIATDDVDHLRSADDVRADSKPQLPNGEESIASKSKAWNKKVSALKRSDELGIDTKKTRNHTIDAIFSSLGWSESPLAKKGDDDRPRREITKPWVLCVDDDPEFSNSIKLRLQQYGIDVLQAFAGMAGYRFAFTHEAQAIILDHDMPDGNGEYVLRRLKENPVTRNIPVIVLTGRNDRALARRMYNQGAAKFLTKPVVWDELWAELRQHIPTLAVPTDADEPLVAIQGNAVGPLHD